MFLVHVLPHTAKYGTWESFSKGNSKLQRFKMSNQITHNSWCCHFSIHIPINMLHILPNFLGE